MSAAPTAAYASSSLSARLPPFGLRRGLRSAASNDRELAGFLEYMEKFKNHERSGVPKGAGTNTCEGFDLGRMRRLMNSLGDPHYRFQAVHIAGTKGKGSTAAFLSNILRAEGYSVGCYTSPHLLTIRERISLGQNGESVSVEVLNNTFSQLKEVIDQSARREKGALSHFEVFTALAFYLFAQENVNIAIVETGLGGARDATNVIISSGLAASVITTIGEEHLAALGGSLESIARAKAGIIKNERPLVIGGPFDPQIERIIRDTASSMNASVVSACDPGVQCVLKGFGEERDGRPFQTCDIRIGVQQDLKFSFDLPDVKLHILGNHQLQNAAVATCTALCLKNQGWKICDESIRSGLERTRLPGRSQFLSREEVEALGLSNTSVLIDGAHTEASAKCLGDLIENVYPRVTLALVVAMASDKNHYAFAKQMLVSGLKPNVVLLTEASIAGGRSRTTPSLALKDAWATASENAGLRCLDIDVVFESEYDTEARLPGLLLPAEGSHSPCHQVALVACRGIPMQQLLKISNKLLQCRRGDSAGLVVVSGSLHIVSEVLSLLPN